MEEDDTGLVLKMNSDMKICPFCGEEILAVAIRCKHCQAMLAEPPPGTPLPPGTQPGRTSPAWSRDGTHIPAGTEVREYRIVRLLGEGGMGEVYKAEHTYTEQIVAIKAVHPGLMADHNVRRRFLEEGRVMATLKHANIVTLHTFFEEAGRFFLIMEFIDGHNLEELLKRGAMERGQAVEIIDKVLTGLHYAHTRSNPVIHRDIKPANIMVEKGGRVVVTDFGIARALGREKLTKTGSALGTFEYMSPEQIRGVDLDFRSDLYSVAVTLFQLVSGAVPFPQESTSGIECMNAHLNASVPDLSGVGVPRALRVVIEKALAKDPAERFASGEEFRAALSARPGAFAGVDGAASAPHSAPAPSALAPIQSGTIEPEENVTVSASGGKRVMWAVLAVLALLVVVVGVLWGMGERGGKIEKQKIAIPEATTAAPAAEPAPPIPGGESLPEPKALARSEEAACAPSCGARECGDDGCGGSCGDCPTYYACESGRCLCIPQCAGKLCGPDQCGSTCGTCSAGSKCQNGSCSCVRQCADKSCGPDGCGGTCGSCATGLRCSNASCIAVHDPCSYGGLGCSSGSHYYSDVEKAQRAVFDLRKAGSYTEALCIAKWLEDSGKYLPAMTRGRLYYDSARAWYGKGCEDSACTAISRSLDARPKTGRGFEITCEQCRSWGCSSCPGC